MREGDGVLVGIPAQTPNGKVHATFTWTPTGSLFRTSVDLADRTRPGAVTTAFVGLTTAHDEGDVSLEAVESEEEVFDKSCGALVVACKSLFGEDCPVCVVAEPSFFLANIRHAQKHLKGSDSFPQSVRLDLSGNFALFVIFRGARDVLALIVKDTEKDMVVGLTLRMPMADMQK
jgi:hypothetical protein